MGFLNGKKNAGGGKKQVSTPLLLAMLALGVVFMFLSVRPDAGSNAPSPVPKESLTLGGRERDYRERLEEELAGLLQKVQGAGEVAVMITLESGPVYEYAKNDETTARTTREQDSGGGTRVIEENTQRSQAVVTRGDGGAEAPLVVRESYPPVLGVIVIAEGAKDPRIAEQLLRAVQAGLNLPAHRITILPMKQKG